MQTLDHLDGGDVAPVDGLDVPDGDGAEDAAEAVAKERDGQRREDHGGGIEGQVVEEALGSEDGDAGSAVGRRGGCDAADGVLLEVPGPAVDELPEPDAQRKRAVVLRVLLAIFGFEQVAAGEDPGPAHAEEVGDEQDEGA